MDILSTLAVTVGAVILLLAIFWGLDLIVRRLPRRARAVALPVIFAGPAVVMVFGAYLIPTIFTVIQSFQHRTTGDWVGLANYVRVLANPNTAAAFQNTLLWLLMVPGSCVLIGLAVAGLTDRLPKRAEAVVKSIVFMPMAISFIGATAIWSLVYAYQPAGRPQVGMVNEIVTLLGGAPRPWIIVADYKINTIALSMIMVWMFAGFAMVNLAAAIRGVPEETVEAARLEGASAATIFWRVIVPQIRGTIVTVFTAIALLTLKIFDVVYSMTGGRYDTEVVGNLYFTQAFVLRDRPFASVLVVLLLVAVIPFMWLNLRQFLGRGRT